MSNNINIGIVGGAGYTGGELIRLLLQHEYVNIQFVLSRTFAGNFLHDVHKDLLGETDILFTDKQSDVDVLFLCLPHGESKKWLEENKISATTKVIDLGNDYRVNNVFGNNEFVYGLPEINKDKIAKAQFIANPGCFATAIQLGVLPLIIKRDIKEINAVGITGSTGAGQALQDTTGFNWRNNNISAYKTLTHQHLKEIKNNFSKINNQVPEINFVPWRGNFTRGIFVSSIVSSDLSLDELYNIYTDFYKDAAFVIVSKNAIDLKQVVNTNKCLIQLEKEENKLVIHSAIDNLMKGASRQAIQNMNIMFGLNEKQGLKLKSVVF